MTCEDISVVVGRDPEYKLEKERKMDNITTKCIADELLQKTTSGEITSGLVKHTSVLRFWSLLAFCARSRLEKNYI